MTLHTSKSYTGNPAKGETDRPLGTYSALMLLSGLQGTSMWCSICEYMTDHNTLYHQDIINLHRETREGE